MAPNSVIADEASGAPLWITVFELGFQFVEAIIWPTVVLIITLLFHKELRKIVSAIRRLRLPGGTEVDIGELVEDVEESAKRATDLTSSQIEPEPLAMAAQGRPWAVPALDLDHYRSIALVDPNLALAGLRMGMERALTTMAERAGVPQQPRTVTTARVAKVLADRGVLPQEVRTLARELAELANVAIHGGSITAADALRAIDAAEPLRRFYVAWMLQQTEEVDSGEPSPSDRKHDFSEDHQ